MPKRIDGRGFRRSAAVAELPLDHCCPKRTPSDLRTDRMAWLAAHPGHVG